MHVCSPEWIANQVPQQRTPYAPWFFGCPNDRNAPRLEDSVEGMVALVTKNGGGRDAARGRWSFYTPCIHISSGPFLTVNLTLHTFSISLPSVTKHWMSYQCEKHSAAMSQNYPAIRFTHHNLVTEERATTTGLTAFI